MAQSSTRRGVLIGLGALAIVAGLVAAVAMWNIGGDRRRDAVEGFARAPVGCDTTLDFVETGEYFVFVERAGRLDGIRGDCDVEGAYDIGPAMPDVEITVVDPDGNDVALDRTVTALDYDEGGFVGSAAFTVDIAEPNDHVVRVQSTDPEVFVVAFGRDPAAGVAALRGGAAAVGLLALLLGAGLILLGARRTKATIDAPQWAPGPGTPPGPFAYAPAPQGPPVYGQPAGPPQYANPAPPIPGQAPPPPYGQAPQYGQVPPAPPQYAQPQYPQYGQQQPPGPPVIPGQPSWGVEAPQPPPPAAPAHPAASAQPTEWAPQRSDDTAVPDDTAPPDEDFLARIRDERGAPPPPT